MITRDVLYKKTTRCFSYAGNFAMSSKRRTFHVDWDSPSHETGTVKRRPASLSASLENAEYRDPRYLELSRAKAETKEKKKCTKRLESCHLRKRGRPPDDQDGHPQLMQTPVPTKADVSKDFGLTLLTRQPYEYKSVVCHKSSKSRSLIPRLPRKETKKCSSGLITSSSSESSGFGSPLSPLSPQRDPPIGKDTSEGVIKISESKSSGLGSSDTSSPEGHEYSAFHLVRSQSEKLRNCLCEKRQAEVIWNLELQSVVLRCEIFQSETRCRERRERACGISARSGRKGDKSYESRP